MDGTFACRCVFVILSTIPDLEVEYFSVTRKFLGQFKLVWIPTFSIHPCLCLSKAVAWAAMSISFCWSSAFSIIPWCSWGSGKCVCNWELGIFPWTWGSRSAASCLTKQAACLWLSGVLIRLNKTHTGEQGDVHVLWISHVCPKWLDSFFSLMR